jgi:hypothetical protein
MHSVSESGFGFRKVCGIRKKWSKLFLIMVFFLNTFLWYKTCCPWLKFASNIHIFSKSVILDQKTAHFFYKNTLYKKGQHQNMHTFNMPKQLSECFWWFVLGLILKHTHCDWNDFLSHLHTRSVGILQLLLVLLHKCVCVWSERPQPYSHTPPPLRPARPPSRADVKWILCTSTPSSIFGICAVDCTLVHCPTIRSRCPYRAFALLHSIED